MGRRRCAVKMTSKPTPKCNGNLEERERRVTRQMTAADLDSRNPLHIPEILERILKLLPVQDLRSCRLVSKFWRDATLKPMQSKCEYIHVGGPPHGEHPGNCSLQDMERFVECFTGEVRDDQQLQTQMPCTKFALFTDIIRANSSDKEKSIVVSFLKTISPSVTEMVLYNGSELVDVWKFVEGLNFPYLKHLGFDSYGSENSRFCAFGQWMSSFITNSPLLRKIGFVGALWDSSFSLVLNVLVAGQYLKLEELVVISLLENDDFVKLCEANLKFKKLALLILSTSPQPQQQWFAALMQFLKSQSETLEDIMIRNPWTSVLRDVPLLPFPDMKRLKSLLIHGRGLDHELINYRKQMPSLNEFNFVSNELSHFSDYLRAEIEPAQSVKKLGFFMEDPTVTPQEFLQAVRIFPNVTKLCIPACPAVMPIVFDHLSNLEEVTLQINDGDVCIDRMLTGLTEDGYQDALRRMRNWSRNFDDSGIMIGANHSPISVLSKLRVLKLYAEEPRAGQLEVTKVSICLALLKMPSLKVLDLGQRVEPPDEMIQGRVLKEFRKHRLILWKIKDADNR